MRRTQIRQRLGDWLVATILTGVYNISSFRL